LRKNRSKRGVEKSKEKRSDEYLVVNYKVVATFIVIFGMCRKEGV
jgi:hypothetical protein